MNAGTWYHLVGVYNLAAQTIALYVNGALQATTAFTTPWQATGNTMIGQGMYCGGATDFVSGKIDDVALYSSALTAAQVAVLNPPVIATGYTTSCVISSGNAYCWGDDSTGNAGRQLDRQQQRAGAGVHRRGAVRADPDPDQRRQ